MCSLTFARARSTLSCPYARFACVFRRASESRSTCVTRACENDRASRYFRQPLQAFFERVEETPSVSPRRINLNLNERARARAASGENLLAHQPCARVSHLAAAAASTANSVTRIVNGSLRANAHVRHTSISLLNRRSGKSCRPSFCALIRSSICARLHWPAGATKCRNANRWPLSHSERARIVRA